MKNIIVSILAAACIAFAPGSLFAQGSLTPPPGAPAPTMKTLDEVEARTNLQATPAPAGVVTTDTDYHFIITQAGSYYLSANLGVTKTNGIRIAAEGVTLDLNGFEISRASGTGGNGIEIADTARGTSIRNGSLTGFARGIDSPAFVDSERARGCAFRDLAVSQCTDIGIFAGEGAMLESCRVYDNTGENGIRAGDGSTLSNCTAYQNTVSSRAIHAGLGSTLTNCTASYNSAPWAISAGSGSTLTHCTAYFNTSSASVSGGISSTGSTIVHCTASRSTSTAATITPTTGMGFHVGGGGTIQNSTATGNRGNGIVATTHAIVLHNICHNNGFGVVGDGAGIFVSASGNRIEGNNVTNNTRGIHVTSSPNIVIGNTASGNDTNWDISAGNAIHVIDAAKAAAFTGDSGGVSLGSTTSATANYTY